VYCKPYKVPVHLVSKVEQELQLMLRQGIIEPSDSNYASPMVVINKKGSDAIRICVDYTRLNAISINDPMPQPDIEDILSKLKDSKIFSNFDATKGFYGIPMDPTSKDYTSFITGRDSYRFNVLPFGLSSSPASYSRLMRKILENAENLDNFVDDIIEYTSDDFDEHLRVMRDLFERVRRANIKLRPTKAKIGFREIQFLGSLVSEGQVRPTQESVEKILNAVIPKTKKGVRSLLGCINWLSKYIPGAALLKAPLSELTSNKASEVVKWGPAQEEALNKIKYLMTTEPVLRIYQANREHVVQTDASDGMLGGVLLQREDDGLLHPIMYASRKCLDREMRYDIQNKEMTSIVWCCRRFFKYLYGSHFTIQTDCAALAILNAKPSNNARVARMQMEMQSYDYRVQIIAGKDNGCSDWLSRMGT